MYVVKSDDTGDLVGAFGEFQRMKGLSPRTVKRRSTSLNAFQRYIHPAALVQADSDLIEEWLSLIPHVTTRAAYRSDLNMFYRWAYKRRIIPTNPVEDVETVKVPQGLPHPVDPAAVSDLIRYAPDEHTRLSVALAAYAGLRVFEIAALTTADLSLASAPPVLVVRHGKGNKARIVPLHPELVALLRHCEPGRLVPLTSTTIGRKVKSHLQDAGYQSTAHHLRHTFGTEAARVASGNLLLVRDLMGHTSMETTQRYTAFAQNMTAPVVAAMYGDAS